MLESMSGGKIDMDIMDILGVNAKIRSKRFVKKKKKNIQIKYVIFFLSMLEIKRIREKLKIKKKKKTGTCYIATFYFFFIKYLKEKDKN